LILNPLESYGPDALDPDEVFDPGERPVDFSILDDPSTQGRAQTRQKLDLLGSGSVYVDQESFALGLVRKVAGSLLGREIRLLEHQLRSKPGMVSFVQGYPAAHDQGRQQKNKSFGFLGGESEKLHFVSAPDFNPQRTFQTRYRISAG
jgi:hypothetical protein